MDRLSTCCEWKNAHPTQSSATAPASASLHQRLNSRPLRARSGGTPFFRAGAAQRQGGTEAATPRGLTFYATLLEFWLTDGDEPVPLASSGEFASRTPAAPQTALTPLW